MALLAEVKYETEIKEYEDISPEAVVSMLHDVQAEIRKLDGDFAYVNLAKVLAVIEEGRYEVNMGVPIRIDLFSAKSVISVYREYSEGGCNSCVSLGREVINAQDAELGYYCQVSDPDYDANTIGDRPKCKYSRFSPKVKQYFNTPCDSWKPRCSPKLEELVSGKQ